jgi:predicted nucleotidyltransferase
MNNIPYRVKNLSIKTIIDKFQELDYIKIALLFGSRANGKKHIYSDYDFAILTEDGDSIWGDTAQAWSDIADILYLRDNEFDIVDLKVAKGTILDSIKEQYILLKGDESELQRLLAK